MGITIVHLRNKNEVQYEDLQVGDTFERNGGFYIKTEHGGADESNARISCALSLEHGTLVYNLNGFTVVKVDLEASVI